jgi:O-antigen ligase
MIVWLCGLVLTCSVIFGGGTHSGFLGDVIIQLLSIPLLALSLWSALDSGKTDRRTRRTILVVCGAVLLLFGLQLLPLPFDAHPLGGTLGADGSISALLKRDWAPLSQTPQATWAAAASLLVPLSIFAAGVQLNVHHRLALSWLLLFWGAVALLLGFLQIVQGEESSLRFYEVTNPSEAVGFFANRNHFAAHLYVTLVLGAVWFANAMDDMRLPGAMKSRALLWLTMAAVFLISVAAGIAMARSRAGIFLAIAALAGIVLIAVRQGQEREGEGRSRFKGARLSVIIVIVAALFAAEFGLGNILSRFQDNVADALRWPLAQKTFETALKALPFGTGIGSFVQVYATVESDYVFTYANRAHNDLAEVLLETGILGVFLLLAFSVWFVRRTWEVWLSPKLSEDRSSLLLQRAGTLIVILLLFHSLVDYPLRTTALSSIFAFFCAILAIHPPLSKKAPVRRSRRSHERKTPAAQAIPAGGPYGADIKWPESWQKRESQD